MKNPAWGLDKCELLLSEKGIQSISKFKTHKKTQLFGLSCYFSPQWFGINPSQHLAKLKEWTLPETMFQGLVARGRGEGTGWWT